MHYEKFLDGTVKCIEDEIPFEVPEGWAWTSIDSVAFVTKLAGFEYTKNIAPNLVENGIPLFKGKNVQDSTIIYEFESFIPEEVSDELARSQITRKCILTPYVGTIGNIGIHDQPGKYHLGSNVGKVELYNETVVLKEEWVVYYLQSQYGYNQLTKHMKATAQASISIAAIRDVYLPVPPANEQGRICSEMLNIIRNLTKIDESKEAVSELVNSTKNKILDLAIRGKLVPQDLNDEPASVLLERIREEKERLIKEGKLKRDKKESIIYKGDDNSYYQTGFSEPIEVPYEIPETWAWSNLKELCNYGICDNVPPNAIDDNAWILDLEDIEKDTGRVLYRATNEERKTTSTKHSFHKDMILYSKLRPYLNKVVLADDDGYCTSEIIPLQFPKIILPRYAQLFLMSPFFVRYANHCSYGMKMPRLGTHDGEKALFAIPPYQEQARIVDMVDKFYTSIDMIQESLTM